MAKKKSRHKAKKTEIVNEQPTIPANTQRLAAQARVVTPEPTVPDIVEIESSIDVAKLRNVSRVREDENALQKAVRRINRIYGTQTPTEVIFYRGMEPVKGKASRHSMMVVTKIKIYYK